MIMAAEPGGYPFPVPHWEIDMFLDRDFLLNTETAKKLYINRNTLIYRLNKIQKDTGLDLRKFDDAMTFKTALMVRNHQNSGR